MPGTGEATGTVEIKADRSGFRIKAVGHPDDHQLLRQLGELLAKRHAFFAGSGFRVMTDRPLSPSLLAQIARLFSEYPALSLIGVEAATPVAARPAREEVLPSPRVVRQTLRSGQQVVHAGDVIVVGDVNPGATVAAGGDVLVFGTLRGQAFAGQPVRRQAAVCALRFQASQIRIGDVVAQGTGAAGSGQPERAVYDPASGQVVVEPWTDIRLPEVARLPMPGNSAASFS